MSSAHPYSRLTPDVILDALDSVGIEGDGRLLQLPSYENRVWQIYRDDAPAVVAKFYRPQRWSDEQILEEHAFVNELDAHEIPAVAPLALADRGDEKAPQTLATFGGFRFAVYPRCGGRAPELDDRGTLEWIGRFLGRLHAVGASAPFAQRPPLDFQSFGVEPRAWLLAHASIPEELRDVYAGVSEHAIDAARRIFELTSETRNLRLHGDCHPGNILWTDAGPHFVDFDDARTGPAVQDLWMLLSGDRGDAERQLKILLDGYERFMAFDRRELFLVEALRTLRLLHYAAWIGERWSDPAFPAAFPWFGTQRYWQDRILELREQIAAMDEPPLELD